MNIYKYGFTLIELLVVLLLTSLLMTTLGGILWQVSSGISHAEKARNEALEVHAVFEKFTQDIYAYRADFSALSDLEFHITLFKDDIESFTQSGSLYALKYKIETQDGVTSLIRTVRPLSLNVNPITSILLQIPNPEDKSLVHFGYKNAHTFLPIWTNEQKPPFAIEMTIVDKNGETWKRAVPILTGHEERL